MDAPHVARDGDPSPRVDATAGDESEYERAEVFVGIQRVLVGLKPRDREILLLRLACELSQSEIAGRVGISQMHVSRILRSIGAALTASCGLAVSGATA